MQTMIFKNGAVNNGHTSGSLYNLIVLCIVIFRFKWENLTSISFFGFIDRCQYLKNETKAIFLFTSSNLNYSHENKDIIYSRHILPFYCHLWTNSELCSQGFLTDFENILAYWHIYLKHAMKSLQEYCNILQNGEGMI